MIKFFREIILTIFLVAIISCETNRPDGTLQTESLTQGEMEQVNIILKKLYQSFSYGKAEEPNWKLMSSVFFEGVQFVS
ncbi:hypothetical protein N9896_02370 [bacterium]|nr:hypothetical protein [bacterium]